MLQISAQHSAQASRRVLNQVCSGNNDVYGAELTVRCHGHGFCGRECSQPALDKGDEIARGERAQSNDFARIGAVVA